MNSEKGEQFEEEIARLLSLTEFEVQREIIIGHKKVDLLLTERRFGSTRRIAVECKNHSKKLSQAEVNSIYANYRPLRDSNLIEGILLVTAEGLAPSAMTMIETARDLYHMTSADVLDLVMDFRPYLNGLQRQFDEGGVSSYYIPARTTRGENLETIILEWLADPNAGPIAILGSYGTGKTTLAKRMASLLASKALDQKGQKIPILIRLGDISSEQSLEGLLGKLFTAHSVVRNYNFDAFMSLNGMGRFVIFLDGFDEMKHTLSWEEFKYNLRQLNRLTTENKKVIILGRPTVFLNDQEYIYAIRGLRSIRGIDIKEPGWPEYRELHLSKFSKRQAKIFIQKYLTRKLRTTTDADEQLQIKKVIDEKINSIFEGALSDLSRRPVQLKILAEILPTWKGEIEDLTVSRLYSYFIDLVIEREQEKVARLRFGPKVRRAFAMDLAIFLWQNKGEMSITADNVPTELVAKHCDLEDDIEAARRDLIAACFLDRKLGDSLFFPHRSFQEFLVAEALIEDLKQGQRKFADASKLCNEEIITFMEGLIDLNTLQIWQNSFEDSTGTLTQRFAALWLIPKGATNYLWDRLLKTDSPWYPALLTLAAHTGKIEKSRATDLKFVLLEKIGRATGRYGLVCFWCLTLLAGPTELGDALSKLTRTRSRYPEVDDSFRPEPAVVEFFAKIDINAEQLTARIDKALKHLFLRLDDYCLIGEQLEATATNPFANFIPPKVELPRIEDLSLIVEFQIRYCGRTDQPRSRGGSRRSSDGRSGPGGIIW